MGFHAAVSLGKGLLHNFRHLCVQGGPWQTYVGFGFGSVTLHHRTGAPRDLELGGLFAPGVDKQLGDAIVAGMH
jgi:hypothetical protein